MNTLNLIRKQMKSSLHCTMLLPGVFILYRGIVTKVASAPKKSTASSLIADTPTLSD